MVRQKKKCKQGNGQRGFMCSALRAGSVVGALLVAMCGPGHLGEMQHFYWEENPKRVYVLFQGSVDILIAFCFLWRHI